RPDLLGDGEPLVGEAGRHPDVQDGHVRRNAPDAGEQLRAVGGLGADLDPGGAEQSGEPVAEQRGVVGQGYPHGILAVSRVPSPGGLATANCPPREATRSASADRPVPAAQAPPRPSSLTSMISTSSSWKMRTAALCACACLTVLASASLTTK